MSYNGSGAGGGSLAESLGITPGSQTATILSAVAVGVLGVALVVGAVVYFKRGGSVSGLVQKVKENKGLITKAASMLPLTEEQKAKVDAAINDPTSLLPAQAQQAIQSAKDFKATAISSLPISEEQKAQLTSVISLTPRSTEREETVVVKKKESAPTGQQITKTIKVADVTETKAPETVTVASPPPATPSLVSLHISEEDVAEVQAFLQSRQIKEVQGVQVVKEVKEENP